MVKLQTIAGDSWITCIGKCHEMQAAWKLQSFQDLVHMPGANTTVQSDCIDAGVLLGILEQSFGTQSRGAVAKLVDGKGYNEKAVKIRFDFGKNRCQLFHIRKCFKIQDGNSIFQKQLCNVLFAVAGGPLVVNDAHRAHPSHFAPGRPDAGYFAQQVVHQTGQRKRGLFVFGPHHAPPMADAVFPHARQQVALARPGQNQVAAPVIS